MTDFCLEPSTSNSAAPLMSNNVPLLMKPATKTSAQQGIALILIFSTKKSENSL